MARQDNSEARETATSPLLGRPRESYSHGATADGVLVTSVSVAK